MLGRGISINATTVAVMSVLGPTIGSAILSVAPWPWIFAVNLPVCVLAMLGLRHLPEVPRNNVAFDGISALLSMATLGVFISGVDMMGADLLRGIGLVAIAAVLGIVLMRRASGQTAPLVPVDLLRIRPLAYAVAASACTFAAQMASYVAALLFPAGAGPAVPGSRHADGRLAGRHGAGRAVGGPAVRPLFARDHERHRRRHHGGWHAVAGAAAHACVQCPILAGMFVAGLGFGFFQTPNNRAMLSAAPRARRRAAGGLQATTRVFGQSFGTALVAIAFSLSAAHGPGLALVLGTVCVRAGGGGERHPLQPAADALAALPATT